jgi:hypothetical protein
VQSHVAGYQKQSYTVMVAVTMDGRKLPLFIIVQGRVRWEWGLELDADGPDASAHGTTGWMTVETMLLWLDFIRSLRKYADGHGLHLILGCYAVHRCDAVRERAQTLRIHLHFIPPGLTDIMQPLDRSVLGALKAESRAIYRGDMAHREDKHMTKADHRPPYAGMGPGLRGGDSPRLDMLPPGHTSAGARVADGRGPLTM